MLRFVPKVASRNGSYIVTADDNFGVARVELSQEGQPGPAVVGEPLKGEPQQQFGFVWTFPCGTAPFQVRAFDQAGGEASQTVQVTSSDPHDLDCDGFAATSVGGGDCDDENAFAHPGAPEFPEGFDLNCDGTVAPLAGVDSDGDGVPSISDGGGDCNDTDPTVHGAYFAFADVALSAGGAPITWSPGEALLSQGGAFWELYLNRGGVVEHAEAAGSATLLSPVATGANPGSIAVSGTDVVLGRGNTVAVLHRSGDAWPVDSTIPTTAPVGKLAVARSDDEYVVYQAGTKVWFGWFRQGRWRDDGTALVLVRRELGVPFRPIQVLSSIDDFDTSWSGTFASHGVVHYLSGVAEASDPPGDGVDRDCDGED